MTFEGILYRMRTGCPWRDLPEEFGRWNTVFKRFNLWSKNGVFELILSTQSSSDNCTFTRETGKSGLKLTLSSFYPNPTTNLVNIEYFSYTNEDVWVEVYESSSRQLMKTKIPTKVGINMTEIDLSALSPGLYIIVVRQGQEKESFKQLLINQQ